MSTRRWAGGALGLVLSLSANTAALADVVAVVSAKSSVDHLSRKEVSDLFLGRSVRFPDGQAALPIDQDEGSAARDEFYQVFTGKSPSQLRAHWSKIIFTGRGKPPVAVANGLEARKSVAANPHAIAYLERSMLDETVKVLRVE